MRIFIPLLIIFSLNIHATPFLTQEEMNELGKITYSATLEDDEFMMNKPMEPSVQFLVTPRTDVSRYPSSLVKQAQEIINEYIYPNYSCVFSPWQTLDAIIMSRLEDDSNYPLPLVEVFALAYIRGIPQWQKLYERLSTHNVSEGISNIKV